MANNSNNNGGPIYQQQNHHQQQQQQQQPQLQQALTPFHCKECGVRFDSAQSLEVHLQYHKENLLKNWANQAAAGNTVPGDEANNNTTKIKREPNLDTGDKTNQQPESPTNGGGVGATPTPTGLGAGHPSTPQSYHSAPSPYQNDPSNFSPNFHHNFHVKSEVSDGISSPILPSFHPHYQNMPQYADQSQQFFEPTHQLYAQDYLSNKMQSNNYHRYQPYQNPNAQVTSSSSPGVGYGATQNTQPTPSPSPKQCDKCGYVCDTAGQLMEHLQIAHPSSAFTNQFQFPPKKKEDGEPQAEILDLDSQKVHVYQTPEEQEQQDALKRQQAELVALSGAGGGLPHHPHSVSAMLSTWPPQSTQQNPQYDDTAKMYNGMSGGPQEPKLFQPHQMHNHGNNDYLNVSTTTHHENPNLVPPHSAYRPYDHIQVQTSPPIISSTQIVPNPQMPSHQNNLTAPITTKGGANWKSNEARRPKTYNCSACNKWFTSSGHLKRHYNTTLHKNAVKSSGQPDPATLPISAHHHPTRDPNHHSNRQAQAKVQQQQQQQQLHDVNSQSPGASLGHMPPAGNPGGSGDDTNSDENALGGGPSAYDSRGQHTGLLQQPPSGPYDRHPPNITNSLSPNLTNLSSGSPPNGEAGPSAINELSRGLQLQSTTITTQPISHQSLQLSNIHPQISPTTTHHQLLPPFNIINQQGMMDILPTSSTQPAGFSNQSIFHPITQMGGPGASHHQLTSYPNEVSPHVTQAMVVINNNSLQQLQLPVSTTISHNSIGEEYNHMLNTNQQQHPQEFTNLLCIQNNDQQLNENGPLPSFAAQFAALGVQVNCNSNVGGPSSVTDSSMPSAYHQMYTTSTHTPPNMSDGEESEFILPDMIDENARDDHMGTPHMMYRTSPPEHHMYQHHVLQPIDQNILASMVHQGNGEKLLMYSPTNNNFDSSYVLNNNMMQHGASSSALTDDSTTHSSYKSEELENEMETSSPLITSTGSPKVPANRGNRQRGRQRTRPTATVTSATSGHKCHACDKSFNKACYLTQHNKTFHCGDKPYKCNRCGKRFSDDVCYHIHVDKHAGDKPHKCILCPKQFNHKTDLRRHMCLHSGHKPFTCDTCGKGFIRKDHMVKHCDTHTRKSTKLKEQQANLKNNNNNNNTNHSNNNSTNTGNNP